MDKIKKVGLFKASSFGGGVVVGFIVCAFLLRVFSFGNDSVISQVSDTDIQDVTSEEVTNRPAITVNALITTRENFGIQVKGQVKNVGNQDLHFVRPIVTLHDKGNSFLTYESGYVDQDVLKPNETATFTLDFMDDNPTAVLKNTTVTFNGQIGDDSSVVPIQSISQ